MLRKNIVFKVAGLRGEERRAAQMPSHSRPGGAYVTAVPIASAGGWGVEQDTDGWEHSQSQLYGILKEKTLLILV